MQAVSNTAGCSFTTILPSAKERRDIIKPELLSRPDFRALIAFIKSRERTWDKKHPAAASGSGGVKFNVSVFVNSQTFHRFTGQKAQEELLRRLRQLKLSTLHTPPGQKYHCGHPGVITLYK